LEYENVKLAAQTYHGARTCDGSSSQHVSLSLSIFTW